MNSKESSGTNPTPDYEKDFREFEYEMNEFDRVRAEFEEQMKIPEIEEFDRMMKAYDRFFNNPRRMKKHIDMLMQTSARPEPKREDNYGRFQEDYEHPEGLGEGTFADELEFQLSRREKGYRECSGEEPED